VIRLGQRDARKQDEVSRLQLLRQFCPPPRKLLRPAEVIDGCEIGILREHRKRGREQNASQQKTTDAYDFGFQVSP